MDPTLIIIIACVVVFGILPLFFRSNAVLIFFALSAGELLARLTGQEATQLVRSLPATSDMPVFSIVQIALLIVAPLVVLFGYRNSTKPGQLFFHVLPALASVVVAIMLVVAKLPYDTKTAVEASSIYGGIEPFFSLAVAAGLFSSIMYLIVTKPKHHGHHKKHK